MKLFSASPSSRRLVTARRHPKTRLNVESLEHRSMLAVVLPSLPVGSPYQLAFVTANAVTATNTSIDFYNTFVNEQAALNRDLPAATWSALVSTPSITAKENASSFSDIPIYNTRGERVASGASTWWYPEHTATLAYDQYGLAFSGHVWTGSNSDGSAAQPLGPSRSVTCGWNVGVDRGWMNGDTRPSYFAFPVYALSSVLTAGATLTVPSSPANVNGAAGDARVSLTWAVPANNGGSSIIDYVIQYSSDAGRKWNTFSDGVSTATSTTVTGLTNGSSYVFRVAAVNAVGTGEYSAPSRPVCPVAQWIRQVGGLGNDTGSAVSTFADGAVIVAGSFSNSAFFGPITLAGSGGFIAKADPRGTFTWAQKIRADVRGICTLGDGSAIVVGEFHGTSSFGSTTLTSAGSSDAFVAKLDRNGNFLWARKMGGDNLDGGVSISALADGSAIVAGYFFSSFAIGSSTLTPADASQGCDLFVAKLDAAGNFLWARGLGATASTFNVCVSSMADGSSILSGPLDGVMRCGPTTLTKTGASDMFVAKLDASGSFVWANQSRGSRGTSFTASSSHVVDGDGSTVVTGSFSGTATFGSTTLTTISRTNPYFYEPFVAKLDASGRYLWAKALDVTGTFSGGHGVGIDRGPDGSMIVTGSISQILSAGAYVAKLDTNGNALWISQSPGMTSDVTRRQNVSTLADGSTVVIGDFKSARFGTTTIPPYGGSDAVVAKLDLQGSWGNTPRPLPPTTLGTAAGPGSVTLAWATPANNGGSPIVDYVIQYSSNAGSTWTTFNDGVSNATRTTVTGLANGVSYVFRVLAVNAAGLGEFSAISAPVTPRTVPGAPRNVVCTPGNARVALSWNPPASTGGSRITNYVVQYSSNGGKTWRTFVTNRPIATSVVVTGLINGVSYRFRVGAVNAAGLGSWSAVSAEIKPQPPSASVGISPITIPGKQLR